MTGPLRIHDLDVEFDFEESGLRIVSFEDS